MELYDALLFLHVADLRGVCDRLGIDNGGLKPFLIDKIVHFYETGEILSASVVPQVSLAKKGVAYPLHVDTLMLKGAYKNDLKTRLFFKSIIGEYFHFTVFGIDWLNDRWLAGLPPTYGEFATFWKETYSFNKAFGSKIKDTLRLNKFCRDIKLANKGISKQEVLAAWSKKYYEACATVKEILPVINKIDLPSSDPEKCKK
jgi:hypothetical protein